MVSGKEDRHEGCIILDGGSGANIIKDRYLLTNIRAAPKPLSISGITEGPALLTSEIGDLPFFGVCYFDARARANVLCQTKIEDEFQVKYLQGRHYKIRINSAIEIEFRRKGTKYVCPNEVLLQLSGRHDFSKKETSNPATVDVNHTDVSEENPTGGAGKQQQLMTQSL